MYRDKTIGVVIPAHNEENQISGVLDRIPSFVDRVIVVDDESRDNTSDIVEKYKSDHPNLKIDLIGHTRNRGCGAARVTGLKRALEDGLDVVALIDGDGQMAPADLPKMLDPIVDDGVDFVKGNRWMTGEAWRESPKARHLGNAVLSLLTKVASGYWHLADSQCGYMVLTDKALRALPLDHVYRGYGMPNDLLVHLNVHKMRARDVPIKPLYNVGERSGLSIWKATITISLLLFRRFWWRLKEKYVVRDLHPLILSYVLAFFLLLASIPLGVRMFYFWIFMRAIPPINTLAFFFCVIVGFQSLFFAMWFDIDYNRDLD